MVLLQPVAVPAAQWDSQLVLEHVQGLLVECGG